MLEQVKDYLINKYQTDINKFNSLKDKMNDLEKQIAEDDSEEKYKNDIKSLNKKYSLFKRGNDYKKEKSELEEEYHNSLLKFKEVYDQYLDVRKEASKIDIYGIQRKLEKVNNSKDLKDLKLTEETATQVLMGEKDI